MTTPSSAIFWSRPRYDSAGFLAREPSTHALPTTWRHTAKWGESPRPAGRASPVEGQPLRRGTLHACYWNSLLGALTQALILTAAHADTSQLKSKARKVADVV